MRDKSVWCASGYNEGGLHFVSYKCMCVSRRAAFFLSFFFLLIQRDKIRHVLSNETVFKMASNKGINHNFASQAHKK